MLSGNINIEDDDWDSVRQGYAALTRDLERLYLSFGKGGNDLGGGSPKSANNQTVAQDGNYGFQAVTTDMLDAVIAELPSPQSLSVGSLYATGKISPSSASPAAAYSSVSGSLAASLSGNTFTAPSNGVYTAVSLAFASFFTSSASLITWTMQTNMNVARGALGYSFNRQSSPFVAFTVSGVSPVYMTQTWEAAPVAVWTGELTAGQTIVVDHYIPQYAALSGPVTNRLWISAVA